MRNAVLAVFMAILYAVGPAEAVPITYTFQGTGTGELDRDGNGPLPPDLFADAPFQVQVQAETDDVYQDPMNSLVWKTVGSPAVIAISGIGQGWFLNDPAVFVNHGTAGLGLQRTSPALDLLDINHLVFASYGLTTNIGPVFDPVANAINQFQSEPLDIGLLSFDEVVDVAFWARLYGAAVPEPASLSLLALGALALRRKARKMY